MKKSITALTVLLMIAVSILPVFASGGQEADQSAAMKPAEPVEIQFWTRQTQSERQEQIQVLLEVFQTLNPDIKVKMLPVEENEFSTQLAASGAANRPNLIEIQGFFAMSYNEEGIVDTQANKNIIESVGSDAFYPGALNNTSMADGSYFGIPFHFAAQGLWYRTDWFEEAGLEAPTTWENILKAAEYFNDPANKQYGILIGTKPENYTQQVFTHLSTANGAHLFDDAGNLALDTPEFREAVEYYKALSEFTPPGPQTWRARDYYIQGKMAMFYYSTYIMDDLSIADVAASSLTSENFSDLGGGSFDDQLVKNTGFVPVISNTESSGYGEIMTLSVLRSDDAAKTAAAERLAEFFLSDENYIPYLHVAPGGMLAMKKSVLESDKFMNDPKGVYSNYGKDKINEIAGGLADMQDFLRKGENVYPESSSILQKNLISQMLYNITIEDKDIDAEIARTEKEIERLLEN